MTRRVPGQYVVAIFLIICFTAIVLFLLINGASGHDIYTGVRNFNGVLCCDGQDCKVAWKGVDFTPVAGGYEINQTKEVIEPGRTGISPDAFFHICRRDDLPKTVRCLLVPDSGS